MFYKHFGGGVTILLVYVDDIIIAGSDEDEIRRLKGVLTNEFEIKDLGKLKYFLGLEVARSKEGIVVLQTKYKLDLLKKFGVLGSKLVDDPIEFNHKIGKLDGGKKIDREKFQRLVGRLIYLSHTRPNISFAMSVISQFMHAPQVEHLEAAFRILKYLKGSPSRGLIFKKGKELLVEGYSDTDWLVLLIGLLLGGVFSLMEI